MNKPVELEGLCFSGAEATDLEGIKRALRKCQNEAEKAAVCELWNNSCETVGYFYTVMTPALLADIRFNWEG